MATIYFGNPGKFDVRAMLTFGVSAKESDNAIGYFGTGFKYAVAIILRLGGSIKVRTENETHEFTSSRETIRGKDFDIVKVNAQDAGFTTRLGINWEPWQAFRELWCNCKDEGGAFGLDPIDMDTVIEVRCNEIERAYNQRSLYFLEGDPAAVHHECDIYDKPSHFAFYRGIAVMNLGKHALYSYNIKANMELTEDRTVRHGFYVGHYIKRAMQSVESRSMLRRVLTADREVYEAGIQYDPDYHTSDEFVEVVRTLLKTGNQCSEAARNAVKKKDELAGNWPEHELTRVQSKMLERACHLLQRIGVDTDLYPLKIVNGLGDGVMGRALEGTMYLSPLPFNMGAKQVASTILEEWVHTKTGCSDFDRAMQSWLFDKILSLAEEITGEPV
jgi:hypothetical protein